MGRDFRFGRKMVGVDAGAGVARGEGAESASEESCEGEGEGGKEERAANERPTTRE